MGLLDFERFRVCVWSIDFRCNSRCIRYSICNLSNWWTQIADIYSDWYNKSELVLQATKKAFERRGLDTTEIDDINEKYEDPEIEKNIKLLIDYLNKSN